MTPDELAASIEAGDITPIHFGGPEGEDGPCTCSHTPAITGTSRAFDIQLVTPGDFTRAVEEHGAAEEA